MNKFLGWFFAIYWVVMGIMCFTGTITLTPFSAGFASAGFSSTFFGFTGFFSFFDGVVFFGV